MRTSSLFLSIFALLLAGCGSFDSASVEVATPIAVFTEAPAVQPVAQATAKPTVAATSTPLPSDTPTSEPSATPTDKPTATPTTAPTEIAATATFTPTLALPTATVSATATVTATAAVTVTVAAPVVTPEAAADEAAAETPAIYAGMPAEFLALMPAADTANGEALTVSNGCTACHSLEKDVRLVGPSWYGVGADAGERVEGQSPGLYLYASIIEPNVYLNEGYIAGLMPQTYKDVFSSEQIGDIIAYLLTLQGK